VIVFISCDRNALNFQCKFILLMAIELAPFNVQVKAIPSSARGFSQAGTGLQWSASPAGV